MLRRVDLRGRPTAGDDLPRAPAEAVGEARRTVRAICEAVRDEGDAAVRRYAGRYDRWSGGDFAVPLADAEAALEKLEPELRNALERAAAQIRWFHERGRPVDWTERRGGATLGVRHHPLRRIGVYAPAGRSPLASTVLMTVVPARAAGVDEIVLCAPPGPDGRVAEAILAAAALAGADRILALGGAQAVAAMAYGTETIPSCDKIFGPGNVYVAEAKQLVAAEGRCGIDTHAGPTEVAIIADETADARLVAADLVAQGEHDPLAACLLITPSERLAADVDAALEDEVAVTRHRDRVRAALDGQGAVAVVDDLDQAVDVANAFAAEHLEVQTADAAKVAAGVRAAGAVFVGAATPVALGDYCAGPNHTLPTGGTARFAGGLRADDFYVPVNWVEYDEPSLADLAPVVEALGAVEDLPAHARAVQVRVSRRAP